MSKRIITTIGAALLALTLATASHAVQLQTMLQGYLTDAAGTPFTGPQAAEFKVFQGGSPAAAGSGTLVYDETATVQPAASGVFNYMLGSGTPVAPVLLVGSQPIPNVLSTATFDTAQAVYVEISVGGTVLLPRLQLVGMPYSAVAGVAESLKPVRQLTTDGLLASSGTFTASGPGTWSIQTSSGISVGGGGVSAPFFNGAFFGNGAGLTGVSATQVAAGSITAGALGPGVLLPAQNLLPGPVTATSGTFTAAGPDQYSLQTSSGINVGGGAGVTAAFFSGSFRGDGAGLTGVSASSVPAASVTPGIFGAGVLLPAGNILPGPIVATSGTFSAAGPGQYSIQTSSGISVGAGGVSAAFFSGSFHGNGAGLTGVGGAAPIGSITAYAGQNEPFGWVECDGRSLPQSGSSSASWGSFNTAALFAAIGTVWGSQGAGQFNIPDLRGIFPRGWNHGKSSGLYDPDANSRSNQYPSGATGDAIGSYQVDDFKSHTHSGFAASGLQAQNGGPWAGSGGVGGSTGGPNSGMVHGNETRAKNASVMYILRVQ
jgi:microcystin-dependent protein